MLENRLVVRIAALSLVTASCLGSIGCAEKSGSSLEAAQVSKQEGSRSAQELRGEIEQFLTGFLGAYMSGSVDSLEPFYSKDALIWADKREPIRGWTAIRALLVGGFEKYTMSASAYLVDVRKLGNDVAFIQILTELKLTSKEDGTLIEKRFRDFALLERSGSSWRVANDIDQPVSAETFDADVQAAGSAANALSGAL